MQGNDVLSFFFLYVHEIKHYARWNRFEWSLFIIINLNLLNKNQNLTRSFLNKHISSKYYHILYLYK